MAWAHCPYIRMFLNVKSTEINAQPYPLICRALKQGERAVPWRRSARWERLAPWLQITSQRKTWLERAWLGVEGAALQPPHGMSWPLWGPASPAGPADVGMGLAGHTSCVEVSREWGALKGWTWDTGMTLRLLAQDTVKQDIPCFIYWTPTIYQAPI